MGVVFIGPRTAAGVRGRGRSRGAGAWRLRSLAGLAVLGAACGGGVRPTAPREPTPTSSAPAATTASSPTPPPGTFDSSTPPPAPTPVPPGPYILDLTWVSDAEGWALTADPDYACGIEFCAAVATTADGGTTWRPLPAPPTRIDDTTGIDCQKAACVSHIRFATTTVGYLFGPGLLMTVDGGQTWKQVKSPPVEALEPEGGTVVRVVYDHSGCPGPCNRTVEEAPAGSTTWETLLQMPQGAGDTATVIRQGTQVIHIPIYGNPAGGGIGDQEATLYRSLDGGQTWQELPDPCAAAGGDVEGAIGFAAAPGRYLAALCEADSDWAVLTSGDAGSSRSPLLPVPESYVGLIAAPSAGDLVIGSAWTGAGGPDTSTLSVSADGGRSWSSAATDQGNATSAPVGGLYLGFEDALTGRWVSDDQTIWTTTDGGVDWAARPFVLEAAAAG